MKKALYLLLFVSLISSFTLTSCQKATYLRASVKNITTDRSGDSFKIALTSDADNFKLEVVPNWVEAKIEGDTLYVDVPANSAKAERKNSIIISCDEKLLELPVIQSFKATCLNFEDGSSHASVTFTKDGGTQTVNIKTDAPQLQFTEMIGVTTTYKDGQLTITAQPNTGKQTTGTITLTADELTASVDVTIQSAVCSRCGGKGKITCPNCDGFGYTNGGCDSEPCLDCGGDIDRFGKSGTGKITCPKCHGTGH